MAISSIDDILKANALGNRCKYTWNKQTGGAAYLAGRWYNTATLNGKPPPMLHTLGRPNAAMAMVADTTPGIFGTIFHGGNVAPLSKYLTSIEVHSTTSTGITSWLMLVDILMTYPQLNMNSTSQIALENVAALPRYADGKGVMMFLEATSTLGAANGVLHSTGFTYTNSAGVSGRNVPGTANAPATGGPLTFNLSSIVPTIANSGVTAGAYGFNFAPFFPLAAGDAGVRSVENFQLYIAMGASNAALVLCKPLAQVPVQNQYVPSGRDFVYNIPTMPRVYDGACLAFLLFCGAAAASPTNFVATLNFVWG